MLDVRRMAVLREVAERGSFSAAADALHLTQSAVSQQITALERESGHQLVVRGRNGVRLTEPGQVVVEHAVAILDRLRAAEEELDSLAALEGGRLRLAAFPSVGATIVPEALRAFRARYPKVRIGLVEAEPEQSLPALRTGEVDLALAYDYPDLASPLSHEGLERTLLFAEPLLLALPYGHPLAAQPAVSLADARAETWLAGAPGSTCNLMVRQLADRLGLELDFSFEANDDTIMLGLVASGVGIALLPRLCLRAPPAGVVVRRLNPPDHERHVWAVTRASSRPVPAVRVMVETLRATADVPEVTRPARGSS
jgi:DNA-binding transcriptional LysR family regulator